MDKQEQRDPNELFTPNRDRIVVDVGILVQHEDAVFKIIQILDFETVIGAHVETGRSAALRIAELRPLVTQERGRLIEPDQSEIGDEDWQIAQQRFGAIEPLVDKDLVGRDVVEARAREVGVNTATLYRWLKRYRGYGTLSALIPQKRGWRTGNQRLPVFAQEVINEVVRDFYLTKQRATAQKTIVEVKRLCQLRGIAAPSPSAIRTRLNNLSERDRLRGRGYREKAKNKFTPVPGNFPNADYPLSVVQIDHTPADIILVDDVYRKPIGRPWITLAIDVYSRMVVGYYLSFDPPSGTSVGMCIAQAILPKEEWLLLHKVDADWPVWGVPKKIHADNGPDFRSDNFRKSCLLYKINLEFRPVKRPQYGGHIERMLGNLLHEIHALPGTTFSSIKHKDGYDAEKHASLTKSEFEEWLVTLITKFYHHSGHSGIGMTPLRKWEIGIFGTAEVQGVGLPPRHVDRLTLHLDFLPSFSRTVQAFGVTIDGMRYYAEILRPWINAEEPGKGGEKRSLTFRRDPRDISSIWFFDPDLRQYFKIPFADLSLPPMSIWEYQLARDALKKEGKDSVNERQILDAITELRSKVDAAQEKTKLARRQAQRRKEHEKNINPATPIAQKTPSQRVVLSDSVPGLIDGDVEIFGDIS